ncbi:hypothetical protein [Polyangium sp. 15x6]|uniref:hypothetical protein n=1 Tax=Polyangium sp. 15x6 TaxID=3042687 RepID=UPI00249B06EA|nr:hypothetical protein [Polyangium sp. 15x6]MDI3283629.1 hypothetical protein [Polyangium sp. 15x6]
MKTRHLPEPDPRLPTEIVLASDGGLFLALPEEKPESYAGREIFVGYALRPREAVARGRPALLHWGAEALLGIGSDGRIYVAEGAMPGKRGRKVFRGFRTTNEERAYIVAELHRMVFNLVGAVPRA